MVKRKEKKLMIIVLTCIMINALGLVPVESATFKDDFYYEIAHDDADAFRSGLSFTKDDLRNKITNNSEQVTMGFVFEGVEIPQGTTITSAYLDVYITEYDETWEKDFGIWYHTWATYKVYAVLQPDSNRFTDYADFLSRMAVRDSGWLHTIDQYESPMVPSSGFRRFYVKIPVQNIINQGGWSLGNNLTLMIENYLPSPFRDAKEYITWGPSHDFGASALYANLHISTSSPTTISDFDHDPIESGTTLRTSDERGQTSTTFYSNYTDSFWMFANLGSSKYISMSYRADNFKNWTKIIDYGVSGQNFDVWLEGDGRTFWCGWYESGVALYLRKGQLELDGTSTWLAPAQLVQPYSFGGRQRLHHGGNIITNNEGYPFIYWSKYDTTYGNIWNYVSYTNRSDGYWGKTTDIFINGIPGGFRVYTSCDLGPTNEDLGIYIFFSDVYADYTPLRERLYTYLLNGSTMQGTLTLTSLGALYVDDWDAVNPHYISQALYKWDASSNFKGFGAVVAVEDDYNPCILSYWYRNTTSGSWSDKETVITLSGSDRAVYPQVVVDENNNSVVFWFNYPESSSWGNNSIWYKVRWANGTWGDIVQWKNMTNTIGESFRPTYDVSLNRLDIRTDYNITNIDGIVTNTGAVIADTMIDLDSHQLWHDNYDEICLNYTSSGGFYNATAFLRVDTDGFSRLTSGPDEYYLMLFYANTHYKNFTSGDANQNGLGVGILINSGNQGPSTYRYFAMANENGSKTYELESTWRANSEIAYIDIYLTEGGMSVYIYEDLARTDLHDYLGFGSIFVNAPYPPWNYLWAFQMNYDNDQDWGGYFDVKTITDSNEIWGFTSSDTGRSPISVTWNTIGDFYSYHDYFLFGEMEYYGSPFWSDLNHSKEFAGEDVNFTVTWDDTYLEEYIFSWNESGVWVNDSAVAFLGTPETIMVEKTLPSSIGTNIGYMFYAVNNETLWNSTTVGGIYGQFTTVVPVSHDNTTLSTSEDGTVLVGVGAENDWVFMGERYYFTSYISGADTFKLYLNDGYDIHTINFKWDNATKTLSTDNDENDELVTGLFYSDYTLTNLTYKLVWGWIPDKNIVDDYNVTVSFEIVNIATNNTQTGDTGISFKIYNLGGFGLYEKGIETFGNRTGRVEGGDQFEIWNTGYSGDDINATSLFRRLQHIHTTFSFWRESDYVGGYYVNYNSDDDKIYFGLEYYENGTWINVLEVRITMEESGLVGRGGGSADSSYNIFNVTWWNQGVMEKQDKITVYNHGYSFVGDEPNNMTYNRFWLDLWFNKLNSSTVVGGRVTPYYNGMWEWNGNPFWFGYGDFQPFFANGSSSVSMYYTQLNDADGDVRSCYGLEMMGFYAGIRKVDDFLLHTWQLQDYQIFDVKLAEDRMQGIDTPVFVEPEDISMPKGGGFLQPLVNAIQGIGKVITNAMFGFMKMMIGAIDTILVDWLHSPVSMAQMIDWIMIQSSYVGDWLLTVIKYTGTILAVFTRMITTLLNIMQTVVNWITWTLVYVVGFPIHFLMVMLSAFQGGTYTIGAFTFDFTDFGGLTSSIIQFAPYTIGFMFVSWFVFGDVDMNREDYAGMPGRVMNVFVWFKSVYKDVFWIFIAMQNKIMELYNFIRSHIPGIGGSGGTTQE